jgi:hypothetical protein
VVAQVDINGPRETIRENIKIPATWSLDYYEPMKDKPWFDEGYSSLLHQRKQFNLNNTRFGVSKHWRNRMREYLKE